MPAVIDGENVRGIDRKVFMNRSDVTELILASGLQFLGDSATYRMDHLESVVLPDTLIAIENANFNACAALQSIVLPPSLAYVSDNTFGWCDSLSSITFTGVPPIFGANFLPGGSNELVIYVPDDQMDAYRSALPDSLTLQPSGKNAILMDRTAPESDFSFDAASGTLRSYNGTGSYVQVPEEIGGAKVKHIGDYAFEGLNDLYIVRLPQGVESIGERAFRYSNQLVWVDCPDSVKEIGAEAFSGYWGAFHWPENLETIGEGAFSYTSIGTQLHLPKKVKTIGAEAFAKSKLVEVYFPASLESIGSGAFSGTAVRALHYGAATLPKVADDAYEGCTIEEITMEPEPEPTAAPESEPTPEPTPEPEAKQETEATATPKPKKKTKKATATPKPKKKTKKATATPKPKKKAGKATPTPAPKKKTGKTKATPAPKKKAGKKAKVTSVVGYWHGIFVHTQVGDFKPKDIRLTTTLTLNADGTGSISHINETGPGAWFKKDGQTWFQLEGADAAQPLRLLSGGYLLYERGIKGYIIFSTDPNDTWSGTLP